MFGITFGLGDRSPQYFPETELQIILEEDSVTCKIEEDSVITKITDDIIIINFD